MDVTQCPTLRPFLGHQAACIAGDIGGCIQLFSGLEALCLFLRDHLQCEILLPVSSQGICCTNGFSQEAFLFFIFSMSN